MATYNGERFLAAQLESIAAQAAPPHELVICDDGSTDETLAIAEQFAHRAPFRVRIVHNAQQLGFAENFLKAARLCEGELIAFSDQDDVWHRAKLARCLRALERPDCRLVIHNVTPVDAQLRPIPHTAFPRRTRRQIVSRPEAFDPWRMPVGLAMVFSSWLLDLEDGSARPPTQCMPEGQMVHDEWVYFLATATGSVTFLTETLALYRQHGGNVAGATEDEAGARAAVQRQTRKAALNPKHLLARQARLAHEYAVALDRLATRPLERPERDRIKASAAFYRRIADRQVRRARIHTAGERGARLRELSRLIVDRAYGSRAGGGFGVRSLVKDLVFAVAGPASERRGATVQQ